jgi:hypothetical protein
LAVNLALFGSLSIFVWKNDNRFLTLLFLLTHMLVLDRKFSISSFGCLVLFFFHVRMQDFRLLSDMRFRHLIAALTAQHQQHTKNLIALFYLQYYLFSQLSDDIVYFIWTNE